MLLRGLLGEFDAQPGTLHQQVAADHTSWLEALVATAHMEVDIADEWRQQMVAEVFVGVEHGTVALTAELTTIEMRAQERATVDVAWALEHAQRRDWAAYADLVERTDNRGPDDVASSLAAWIDGVPDAHA
ncbi:MAG: hypothetical protein KY395_07115 [Actinobacteria bacterium]|nr:hypothetical protein [Actinomycetota bacterium]